MLVWTIVDKPEAGRCIFSGMRIAGALALVLAACSAPREQAASRDVAVDEVVAQLAPVLRPEPAGVLSVRLARGATTITRGSAELTISAEDFEDVPATHVDDRTTIARKAGVEVIRIATSGRFEELRRVQDARERIELRYRVTLGGELASLRVVDDIVEALDHNGVARLRTEPAFAVDGKGVVRALHPSIDGDRLSWALDARGLSAPIAIDPAWTTTGSLAVPRNNGDAFPIPGKKVIAIGSQTPVASTEIYDDATKSWTMGPSLSRVRTLTRAAKLTDGRIMIAGGSGDPEDPPTADVYNPTTNTITKTSPMPLSLVTATVAPLAGGAALVTARPGSAIWNPTSNTWTTGGAMITPRVRHYAFTLPSGNVVMVGGRSDTTTWLSSIEQFDATSKTFSALPPMPSLRVNFVPVLSGTKIYVTGGDDGTDAGKYLDTTLAFDTVGKTWSTGPKLLTVRRLHAAARMPDGRVLIAGGDGASSILQTAEIVDFTAMTSIAAGTLNEPRVTFPLVPIVDGEPRFLAVSGYNGAATPTAEVFAPIPLGAACTGTGECASGTCVDGVCCEKPACAAGETCGGAGAPGLCRAINGKTCTTATECASGQCVDGVCCNSACTGVCQACNLTATPGSCATLPPGDSPHGSRAKCPGTGACQGVCGGVEADKCTVFPGAAVACGDASCKDGSETIASFCDGAGGCATVPNVKCEPYACGEVSCKRACAVDGDCASGYSCDARTGRCVFGAKCDGDHTVEVPSAASIDCTPYRCAGSSCIEKCSSTNDCVAGTTCDTSNGKCVAAAAPAGDEGGCSTSRAPTSPPLIGILFMLAALARRSR